MTDVRESGSFLERLKEFAAWLSIQVYFLRFPLLTTVALVGVPYLGLRTDLKSLLANLFVSDGRGIVLISSVAFNTAWTILVTWRLIALYGDERFGRENAPAAAGETTRVAPKFSIRLWHALLASLTALPVTIAVVGKTVEESSIGLGRAMLFAVAGFLGSLLLFFLSVFTQLLVNSKTRAMELAREVFIVRWLPDWVIEVITGVDPARVPRPVLRKIFWYFLGKGFFDEKDGRFLAGHGLAASLLILSLLIFIVAGQFSPYQMSALFFVILLLMLLCWGLSALSFLVDRYRIPVLAVIFLFAYASDPNYYYSVQPGRTLKTLAPKEVIEAGGVNPRQIIVVATEGGGIQAAAWTARVLTGLQGRYPEFGKSLRVISSVSGGSTGALFFVNGYNPEKSAPDEEALDLIVQMAAENSLDRVARSLVYHDFINTLIPFWKLGEDRGTALETSWAGNCQKVCEDFKAKSGKDCPVNCAMAGTLAGWAEDVRAGKRPANIFNATVVENGDRLLISNTDIEKAMDSGRLDVAALLGGKDIQAVTSARLSATFPYVSPAARSNAEEPAGARLHLVDGGYYDNYGMTSLVEWLDRAFEQDLLNQVLVIQIQSFDSGPSASAENNQPAKSGSNKDSGYISQLLAPFYTLLHIRTTAQASHKEIEFDLLRDKWPEKIQTALFKFTCGEAPLTWKLTETEKKHIRDCWETSYLNHNHPGNPLNRVKQFLDQSIKE